MTETKYLRRQELLSLLRIKSTALHDRVKNKQMVTPISYGGKLSVYPEHEVQAISAAHSLGFTDAQIKDLVINLEEKREASAKALLKQLKSEGRL